MSVPSGAATAGRADTQAAFAATLVDEWVRGGVAHAVVCPGSRSTPLAVALAAHRDVTVHVRLDERSAGFTAVGLGLASGRPAVVLTTSGTAAAELHAAVVEADLAGVPMLACTADRPPELRDVGSPQTIDQLHLYGRSVRWFADPGVPDAATQATWRALAARSLAEAVSGSSGPGPVHLNLPFREPLLGDPVAGGGVPPGRPDGAPWHAEWRGASTPDEGWLAHRVDGGPVRPGRRGLLVAGAGCGRPERVMALATALGWPVLADPRSGLRRSGPGLILAADGILRSDRFVEAHRPEVVVRLGERWVSKVVNGFVSRAIADGAHGVVVELRPRWADPDREAHDFVRADPDRFAEAVTRRITGAGPSAPVTGVTSSWLADWQGAEDRAQAVMGGLLGPRAAGAGSGEPAINAGLTEPSLARRLFAALPDDATLVVSSSMPVRDIEAFAGPRRTPPRVLANRGANGIDGVVSTAIGVALSGGGPTVALVGDLAFLHDVSALVGGEGAELDLTVVVADNRGGGIFSFLPPAEALDPATFEFLFGTPQGPDPGSVAAAFGWPVDEVGPESGDGGLEETLARWVGKGSRALIRVRLPDRSANVDQHRLVNTAIVQAVDRPDGV
jgi:2-succinyl-5-enolpyruvyl-6-hydroxy-3-cyclohexene-1-carboxylate synthase